MQDSFTTEEIAKLLKVSKLTVYDLIKKGELPAYRVGKQMRIDASDLDAYKRRMKSQSVYAQTQAQAEIETAQTAKPSAARMDRPQELSNASQQGPVTGRPSPMPSEPPAAAAMQAPPPQRRGDAASPWAPSAAQDAAEADGAAGTTGRSLQRGRSLVITGQDMSLDVLARQLERHAPGIRPLRAYVGSLDSLVAMYRGESDIVSTHLLDGDTGEYNVPYVRKLLVGQPLLIVNLLSRAAGFFVREGNPQGIAAWADLAKDGVRIVNRERGSGARVLLDEQLRLHGIAPAAIEGYACEENSHLAVAGKIALGEADVGIGIERAARIVGGVEFIPMIRERYDLVMLKRPDNLDWIGTVLAILRSEAFRQELQTMQGYDLTMTGEVVYEN